MFVYRNKNNEVYFTQATLIVVAIVSFVAGTLLASYIVGSSDSKNTITENKGEFSYIIIGKNGKEFKLSKNDTLQLKYNDEFVVKEIVAPGLSDTILVVEGVGKGNDIKATFKSNDLMNKIVQTNTPTHYSIRVQVGEKTLASIPMRIDVSAQDWIRYAGKTNDRKERIEYLKKAYDQSNKSPDVRKLLADAYVKAGMKAKATQLLRSDVTNTGKKKNGQTITKSEVAVTSKPIITNAKEAETLVAQKKYAQAVIYYKALLKKDPDNTYAYRRYCLDLF